MPRFNGPSPEASAHAKMMRDKKLGRRDGRSGCAFLPCAFLLGTFVVVGNHLPF